MERKVDNLVSLPEDFNAERDLLSLSDPKFVDLKDRLYDEYKGSVSDADNSDEYFSWISCWIALYSVQTNNLGIGALLVDQDNKIVSYSHNQVFSPKFRSDAHAEMLTINDFESRQPSKCNLSGYTIYSSLEPCPMCLTRLIIAGVGRVVYVADDEYGGMVHLIDLLPKIWQDLRKTGVYTSLECCQNIKNLSSDIFAYNRERLDSTLFDGGQIGV
ncbi:cytosine deaminase [Desulfatibacillum alkenivorans DSM 16219]|jgi:cytosine deaminase|uniref:Cytosine deaminase n=1 Tax=Desulfatibacillum alkenivorans DSM 16219 TaxID=1121393 RepID=A0A1M6LMW8_9BACT|nr:nucleoside deaminase [Desulfatibacillum alkenivorans]SHJ72559.1 cytosine deaminase [Desulfatibacillum alkenivorans DSM 16219]